MITRLIQHPTVRQMLKFGIVGFSTLLIDFGVYIALTRGVPYFRVHYLLANAAAVVIDMTWNFTWNQRWTFRLQGFGGVPQYVSYFTIAGFGFAGNQLLLWLFVGRLRWYDLFAKCVAIVIIFFWNFFMQRAFTFGSVAAFAKRGKTGYTVAIEK